MAGSILSNALARETVGKGDGAAVGDDVQMVFASEESERFSLLLLGRAAKLSSYCLSSSSGVVIISLSSPRKPFVSARLMTSGLPSSALDACASPKNEREMDVYGCAALRYSAV